MDAFYSDDNIEIYNADCTEWLKQNKRRFNLCFTSPPYNMGLRISADRYCKRGERYGDSFSAKYGNFSDDMTIEEYTRHHGDVLEMLINCCDVVMMNIAIVTGSKEAWFNLMGRFAKYIHDVVIWDKGMAQPAMGQGILNRQTELILILSIKGIGRQIQNAQFDRGTISDLWAVSSRQQKGNKNLHSATFPVSLASFALRNFCPSGGSVIDPFCGTGTTLRAAIDEGRTCTGIEIVRDYCETAKSRCQQLSFGF